MLFHSIRIIFILLLIIIIMIVIITSIIIYGALTGCVNKWVIQ